MSKKCKAGLVLVLTAFIVSAYFLISGVGPWLTNPPRAVEQVPSMSGTTGPVIGGFLGCLISVLLIGGGIFHPTRKSRNSPGLDKRTQGPCRTSFANAYRTQ